MKTMMQTCCVGILSLWITFGVWCVRAQAPEGSKEEVCNSIDIRNSVSNFKHNLDNCTVIEGSLQILLIDYADHREYQELSFPKLREITDYLLLYRVYGLRTLAHIFPNLSVIRGQKLFFDYALVAFEMPDLEDIGLPNLTYLLSGAVRLEKNPNLCYIDTLDWSKIARDVDESDNVILQNKDIDECVNVCPEWPNGTTRCPVQMIHYEGMQHEQPLCWNNRHCQKVGAEKCQDRATYVDKNGVERCCNAECIGGCSGPENYQCHACKHVLFGGRCMQRCPPDTYEFHDRRCILEQECKDMSRTSHGAPAEQNYWKLHGGKCIEECPPGFMDNEDPQEKHRCVTCEGSCPKGFNTKHYLLARGKLNLYSGKYITVATLPNGKQISVILQCSKQEGQAQIHLVCAARQVDSVATAKLLKGCTIIKGILEIQIRRGNRVGEELEANLGDIEVVEGHIRIHNSEAIMSLHFLRSLRYIKGQSLASNRYALFIFNNQNLQDIWDFDTHPQVNIMKGQISFHSNPKLCYDKIMQFVKSVGIDTNDIDPTDISETTNGDKMACNNTQRLSLSLQKVGPSYAVVSWDNFFMHDARELLYYVLYTREAPEKNISIFNARDACGSDVWKTFDVPPMKEVDSGHETDRVAEIIYELKPFTQYAIYVQTYMVEHAGQGGMSDIVYFTTKPDVPTHPRNIKVTPTKQGELLIQWQPPSKPNGNVTHYYVYWQPQPLSQEKLDKRNYCEHKLHLSTLKKKLNQEKEEPEPSVHNKTLDPSQCCACPKSKDDLDAEEAERSLQIKFENFLHDSVYIKRPYNPEAATDTFAIANGTAAAGPASNANSAKKRRKRSGGAAPSSAESNHLPSATNTHPPNASELLRQYNSSGYNRSASDISQYSNNNAMYLGAVVYHKTEILLSHLKHFQEYSIEVVACHEFGDSDAMNEGKELMKRCSNRAITTARTLPSSDADNIDHRNVTVQQDMGRVSIYWPDPVYPNGLIVTYEVQYQPAGIQHAKRLLLCFPHKEYRKKMGIDMPDLPSGNFSFRLRATSLAGNGSWTPDMYFYVADLYPITSMNPDIIAAVCTSAGVIFLAIIAGCFWAITKNRSHHVPDNVAYVSANVNYQEYKVDEWEVPREKILLSHPLGQGSFGMVYKGIAKDMFPGKEVPVAVKTVFENASMLERLEFLKEASVMKAFSCNHVVKLLGVVSQGQPTLVIMELMANGDLKNFLRQHRPDEKDFNGSQPFMLKQVLTMAAQIADGMAYLGAKKFVHRDLAARNCMVSEDKDIKIADFGMTRDIYATDYYQKRGKGLLPVRWMAPESLKDGLFTSQSDIWSYGVVMWEMATLAEQPYQGFSNEQVLTFVKDGGHMDEPENCPGKLFDLMVMCWHKDANKRPTFLDILEMLVPDLDPDFEKMAYFFSDECIQHQQRRADEIAADSLTGPIILNDDRMLGPIDEDDLDVDVHTPLTGSPSHTAMPLDCCSDSCVAIEPEEMTSLTPICPHHNSHIPCDCVDIPEDKVYKGKSRTTPGRRNDLSRSSNTRRSNSGSHNGSGSSSWSPPRGRPDGSSGAAWQKPTPSNCSYGMLAQTSSDGSKDSSKSSTSSQHLNGVANGHVASKPYHHTVSEC